MFIDYLKKGHVKGAINIPFRSLFYDDYTLKNLTDLKLLFGKYFIIILL